MSSEIACFSTFGPLGHIVNDYAVVFLLPPQFLLCLGLVGPKTPKMFQLEIFAGLPTQSIKKFCKSRESYNKTLFQVFSTFSELFWVQRVRGRTATQRSKKGSEKVLRRFLGKGCQKGSEKGACSVFCSKKWFWEGLSEGVLRRGFPEGAGA